MRFRLVDLIGLSDLTFQTKIDDKLIFDIFQDSSFDYCAFLIEQKYFETFFNMLMESIYDISKISVWIRSPLIASDLFYASRTQKNCCCFIFWLSKDGIEYPKEFPLNFYIEKTSKNEVPDWLKTTKEVMDSEDIDFELITNSGLTLNESKEDGRHDLF